MDKFKLNIRLALALLGIVLFQGFGASVWAANAPTLIYPADSSYVNVTSITFNWDGVSTTTIEGFNADSYYELEVDNNSDFTSPEVDITTPAVVVSTNYATSPAAYQSDYAFTHNNTYYWRARVCDNGNTCYDWSSEFSFNMDTVAASIGDFVVKSSKVT
jgi:hypothetical protein